MMVAGILALVGLARPVVLMPYATVFVVLSVKSVFGGTSSGACLYARMVHAMGADTLPAQITAGLHAKGAGLRVVWEGQVPGLFPQ